MNRSELDVRKFPGRTMQNCQYMYSYNHIALAFNIPVELSTDMFDFIFVSVIQRRATIQRIKTELSERRCASI